MMNLDVMALTLFALSTAGLVWFVIDLRKHGKRSRPQYRNRVSHSFASSNNCSQRPPLMIANRLALPAASCTQR